MRLRSDALEAIGAEIFEAAGCNPAEARNVAQRLVMSNLVGHDSHGVIRITEYVGAVERGATIPNQPAEVVFETDAMTILDGRFGFGQTVAEQAVGMAMEKAHKVGVAISGLRDAGHVGRLGDWVEMAAGGGLASIHMCNTVGGRIAVTPFGSRDPRLATNPIAMGMPVAGGEPLVLDFATASIAEGKARVAFNKGISVPEGCLVDSEGRATTDPADFYADPPGAILPFGGHKGGGLSFMVDLFSGALAGGRSTFVRESGPARTWNNLISIVVDPALPGAGEAVAAEVKRFADWVRTARPRNPGDEVLLPGDIERRTKADRLANGIPIDRATLDQIADAAESVGVPRAEVEALAQ